MGRRIIVNQTGVLIFLLFLAPSLLVAQHDTVVNVDKKVVTLKEVVVRSNLNVAAFIDKVKKDTTFYKAFKNLHVLGYTALNDVRMMDKKGNIKASLQSKTIQRVAHGCRWMKSEQQKVTGDMFDRSGNWNYYTMKLYASLYWVKDTVCGENNIVGDSAFSLKDKSGLSKHQEQLKMLFFNPGKRVPGIPFVGEKTALFDDHMARYYDYIIDMEQLNGEWCYMFTVRARNDLTGSEKDMVVINSMITWFDQKSMNIVYRKVDLSYDTGVYDFNVQIEAELGMFKTYLVPRILRYTGNWSVIFKKRERGIFTATLFDFTN